MLHRQLLASSLLAAGIASPAFAQITPVALNYNFNGVIHAGEAGDPDNLAGFRSTSDRALDFTAGVPVDALLSRYDLVDAPGAFDLVHLGNRNTVDNGNWAFDATADGDTIGVQPAWLANPDQSGPQTSVITPQPVFSTTSVGFLYHISNGGGSFDVTITFAGGGSLTETLSGPDWFTGPYTAFQNVDQANPAPSPGANLSITEGRIDLAAFAGDAVLEITFSNGSNPIAGYGILGCNFEDNAKHIDYGTGCYAVNEFAGWHQEFATSAAAETALDNQTLLYVPNSFGGYTTIAGAGTFRPGNPAGIVTLIDDSQEAIALPADFNYRGTTPVSTVYVCSNGFLSMGPGNNPVYLAVTDGTFFTTLTDGVIAAYAEDLNPDQGGTISTEYDAGTGVFYITFEDVPHYLAGGAVTFQYQLELASGICTIVYGDLTADADTDIVMIGESAPAATSANPIDLFASAIAETYAIERVLPPTSLAADVPAISTATAGTNVTYSVFNAPDYAPTALPGLKLGLLIGSTAPLAPLPGIDLGFLGSPGCPALVSTLDFVGALDTSGSFVIPYPAGIAPQTTLFFQAAMLFDTTDPAYPSTPAGQNGNTFVQTSNALITVISGS